MILIRKAESRLQGKRKRAFSVVRCPSCKEESEMRNDYISKAKTCFRCINKTHGDTNTRLFNIWSGMKQRVNERPDSYRDIDLSIHEPWLTFTVFKEWAIRSGYKDILSIDRIDNKDGYYPDNCRWATETIQQNNKREIQSNNTSGFKGISKQGEKWRAGKTISKKSVCFGLYDTIEEAIDSYKRNTQ